MAKDKKARTHNQWYQKSKATGIDMDANTGDWTRYSYGKCQCDYGQANCICDIQKKED